MSSGRKVVQTELEPEEYQRLRRVAEEEGRPLKGVLREAAVEYSDRHSRYDPGDPLFDVEPTGGEETDARKTEGYLAEAVSEESGDYG